MLLLLAHKIFPQNGGGIYAENGAKVRGCVISENKATGDGFGICGGDAELLNCTVGNNIPAEKLTKTIDVGYIFCENNSIVSKEVYESEGRTNAAGVVFWVNSDRYAQTNRAYIVGLKQEQKPRGDFGKGGEFSQFAVFDTACYAKTRALVDAGSEAALYCREHMQGTPLEGRWLMPAGFQASCLFTAHYRVAKTLDFLRNKGVDADLFEEAIYWTASTSSTGFWVINFSSETDAGMISSTLSMNELYWVRPILVY